MNAITTTTQRSRFPLIFEAMVWLIYVCLYKYSYFLDLGQLPNPRFDNFPWPELIIYAVCMTIYIIPFYRVIAPRLLLAKKYGSLLLVILLYFGVGLKISNWLVTWIFAAIQPEGAIGAYYKSQHAVASEKLHLLFGWAPNLLLTDLLAFMSVGFMRYAFENEKKKFLLERDNLVLQLESLKSQLHPHFLFNTLNSIYGMSLTGHKDTPSYILRLSDMMRYILYDCQHNFVPLEKDLAFIENYIAMEQARYPEADIGFSVKGSANGQQIVPLLFIQFIENSFKHGAHRVADGGYIHGSLEVKDGHIHFQLVNDHYPAPDTKYGGIGIQNVQKRLQLFYPNRHKLTIRKEEHLFEVKADIMISGVS